MTTTPSARIVQADALEFLASLPDSSVDLVVTDPPYFRVKAEWWDRQWDTRTGFLEWIDRLVAEWSRVLRPNGSLYCFASPQMAAHVEVTIGKRMEVLNHVVWVKPDPFNPINRGASNAGRVGKDSLRSFYPNTERIIFAEQIGADSKAKGEVGYAAKCDDLRGFVFEPIRAYLDGERKRAGLTRGEVDEAWRAWKGGSGGMSSHWFGSSQFALPTAKNYEWLRSVFNRSGGDYLRREYESLRREYESLRREYESLRREYESLRRPFSVTAEVPFTDVWVFPTVSARAGKHPCEKPAELIRHIIRTSSRPGAIVLDSFVGSGVVGAIALEEGRSFIGSEIDPRWVEAAGKRVSSSEETRER